MSQGSTKTTELGLAGDSFFSANDLHSIMDQRRRAELAKDEAQKAERAKAEEEHIKLLMKPVEFSEERLANFMRRVRQAAERGEHQILVIRFPSAMCRDSGRAINNALPGWETTLVGLPEQMVEVWQEHLRPLGFRLTAEVLDYPGGIPGDVGLFCKW